MKFLLYEWPSYLQYDLKEICKERNISLDTFSWKFTNKNEDVCFAQWFEKNIITQKYDALLSVNYWPMLSEVCQKNRLKYIALCYDAPLNVINIEETLGNEVNHVFLFDRKQYEQYCTKGFDTVYHMPLGVNRTRMVKLSINGTDIRKYSSQVSLVGSLYESKYASIIEPLSEYTKGYLKAVLDIQAKVYGYYLVDEMLSQQVLENINREYAMNKNEKIHISKEAMSFALASEITRRDRLLLLSLCGKRYDTTLYSWQNSTLLGNVKNKGVVDYVSEMPKVFACSKVNLNPSLRIIQSGIPLRALDIMGAGGFLLSNYQEELLELYEDERDMVVYSGLEDALEKVDFYIRHDDLRKKIAQNGKEKTLKYHSLQDRLESVLSVTGLN